MALGSSTSSDADRSKAIKIVVAVVLLVVAGVLIFMNMGSDPIGGKSLPGEPVAADSNSQPTPPAKPAAADPNINAIRKGSNATLGK